MPLRAPLRRSILLLTLASVVLLATISVGFAGVGTVPPLGESFNPFGGVWTIASNAKNPHSETLNLPGLNGIVTVSFSNSGVPEINATTNHDLFEAMGYLHAHFRLFEMDILRREAAGGLSQILGRSALANDELELTLGLERTATAEWKLIGASSPVGKDLLAYAAGVNFQIGEFQKSGNLPAQFKLLHYVPTPWTPVDSLLVEGDLTQNLDFTTTPIDYSLLVNSLGYKTTMALFPVIAKNLQDPYDLGPYKKVALAPITRSIPGTRVVSAPLKTSSAHAARSHLNPQLVSSSVSQAQVSADKAILSETSAITSNLRRWGGDSNNWAVDSTMTTTGKAILAGDPHLAQTLPSIWYQWSVTSPNYNFSGVGIPGLPGILIGHNANIAWSLTDTQNQATFFYQEVTSPSRPNQYFWRSKWREMNHITYEIPQRGGGHTRWVVSLTVHGPILSRNGVTDSLWWAGAIPSDDLAAMLGIYQAENFTQFKTALRSWLAPTQNFVYADTLGNIGIIAPGIYPQFRSAKPWLPMSGAGQFDPVGTIPFAEVPQSYDPISHYVFSANQREVLPSYPYYIGTSADFFDYGYRARDISTFLSSHAKISIASTEALQNSNFDLLAQEIVPLIGAAVRASHPAGGLSPAMQRDLSLLQQWDYTMSTRSSAATIWWYFLNNYLRDTFGPLWRSSKVPVGIDSSLALGTNQVSLVEDIEAASLQPSTTEIFSTAITQGRTRDEIISQAMGDTVAELAKNFGAGARSYPWGSMHKREFVSLTLVKALSYGPFPGAGDPWTIDAADGGLTSVAGPSWRFIAEMGGEYLGVYPGGQSENPLSPWYTDQVPAWRNGQYFSMAATPPSQAMAIWTLR